jgi:hypothetical protein
MNNLITLNSDFRLKTDFYFILLTIGYILIDIIVREWEFLNHKPRILGGLTDTN